MARAIADANERVEFLHRSPSGPIAIVISPFDFPQHPRRCWRIMGRWRDRSEFLVVLGATESDAEARLDEALSEVSNRDLNGIQTVWLEQWNPGSRFEIPYWQPIRQVSLRTVRFKRILQVKRRSKRSILPLLRTKGLAS